MDAPAWAQPATPPGSGAPPAAATAAPSSVPAQAAPAPSVPAAAKHLFKLEGTLESDGSAQAVAINADESLLAVAKEDGSTTEVLIFDRPSRTRIGVIDAKVGSHPRMVFASDQDLLLIAGTKAVQLWEVPIVPLKPDQALDEKYRHWSQDISGGTTPRIAFADPPSHAVWAVGGALYRREVGAGAASADKPAWQSEIADRKVSGFAFARGGAGVALTYAGEKGIDLLDTRALTLLGALQGHRFPVAGAVPQGRGWLSLDTGWHLQRWNENLQPQDSVFLEALPHSGDPAGLATLGPKYVLIAVPHDGAVESIVTSAPAWRPEDKLVTLPDGFAISPTGRYVLALEGSGDPVKLYSFTAPEAPLDYVRRLQSAKAYRVAQGYVRLLDDTGLSPKVKASLLSELSQVPTSVKVQDFQDRLARARKEGNPDTVRHWAEQILNLRPQDLDALEAMQELKTLGEKRIVGQAREALKQGQTAQVISMLSTQIPEDSQVHDEAAELIRQAEAQRRVAGVLGQAREQLNLGNVPAATALAEEALREDKDNAAARSLLSEIQGKSGGGSIPRWVPVGAGMALAAALVGFVLYRNRERWMPMLRKAEPVAASSWGGLARGSLDAFGPPAGGPRPSPAGPGGPRPGPANGPRSSGSTAAGSRETAKGARPARRPAEKPAATAPRTGGTAARPPERARPTKPEPSPARLQVIEELLQRTEDMMRLAQQADVSREHTSLLMELDAELSAFHRRLADPAVDLGPIHQRLKTIGAEVRGLKFSRKEPPPPHAPIQPAEAEPTWYEILQVRESASESEIRTSYHKLLKQYHPDLHNESGFGWVREQADRMTKKISAAYHVLNSAEKRQSYDGELRRRRSGGV